MGTPYVAVILALGILQAPQKTVIGEYAMPQLPMWQKQPVENYKFVQVVKYDRKVDGVPLMLKFTLMRRPKELKPWTANDLQKHEAFRKKIFEGMRSELPGFKVDTLTSKVISFDGRPATLNHLRFFDQNKPSSEAKVLTFATAKYDYILSVSAGLPMSSKAQTAMNTGLKTMMEGLRSVQKSPLWHSRRKLRTASIRQHHISH